MKPIWYHFYPSLQQRQRCQFPLALVTGDVTHCLLSPWVCCTLREPLNTMVVVAGPGPAASLASAQCLCPGPVVHHTCAHTALPTSPHQLTTSPRFPHCTSSGGDAGHGPATAPGLQSVFMDQTNYQAKYLGHTMQIKPGQDTRHHEPWSHVSLTLPPGVMMPCRNWAGCWQLACPRCLLSRK